MYNLRFRVRKGIVMKRVLAGLIVSGIILTGGTGQVYAQEVEKNLIMKK